MLREHCTPVGEPAAARVCARRSCVACATLVEERLTDDLSLEDLAGAAGL